MARLKKLIDEWFQMLFRDIPILK